MWVDDNQTTTVLTLLWRASWQAALLSGLVLLLQFIFKNQLTARLRYNLWLIVLLRLLLPVLPQSPLSIYNLFAADSPTPTAPERVASPQIPFAEIIDNALIIESDTTPAPAPDPAPHIATGTIPSAPPAPPEAKPFPWREALFTTWLLGLLFLLTRILIASIKLHRLVRRLDLVTDDNVLNLLDTCKRDLHVRHDVTILSSDEIPAPALMGFLKPRLLLPAHLLTDFDPRELRLVLLHELAHVRRRDVLVNWLATLLHTLHWFNPVLWLALNRVRTDRELATDELVLLAATRPDDRRLYGQTILKLLQQTLSGRTVLPGMVGILEGTHPLRRRITMIAQFKEKKPWSALALVALIGLCAVTLTDPVRGQDADDDEKKDATTATTTEDPVITTERRSPARERTEADRGAAPDPRNPQDVLERMRERRARELGRDTDSRPGRGGGSLTTTADPRRTTVTEKRREEMDAGMRAQFDRKLPEVNFADVPFVEVIEFLRDVTGTNIFVNWRALEAAGIERNAPVNMRMKAVSFATVLRLLLDSTAPGLLDYEVDGGVIIITASANAHDQINPQMMGMAGAAAPAAPAQSITRVYDVRDLLAAAHDPRDEEAEAKDPQINELQRQRAELLAKGIGSDHRQMRVVDEALKARTRELAQSGNTFDRSRTARLSELVSIVQSTIGQDQPLSVRGFNTKLVVRAAPETQTEVQSLLKMLREDGTTDASPRETRTEPARR